MIKELCDVSGSHECHEGHLAANPTQRVRLLLYKLLAPRTMPEPRCLAVEELAHSPAQVGGEPDSNLPPWSPLTSHEHSSLQELSLLNLLSKPYMAC